MSTEQRSAPRYQVHLPLSIAFETTLGRMLVNGTTVDVSLKGVGVELQQSTTLVVQSNAQATIYLATEAGDGLHKESSIAVELFGRVAYQNGLRIGIALQAVNLDDVSSYTTLLARLSVR